MVPDAGVLRNVDRVQRLRIDIDCEDDGRFLASVPDLPRVMAYGDTQEDATRKVKSGALRVLAGMVESGEEVPDALDFLFAA